MKDGRSRAASLLVRDRSVRDDDGAEPPTVLPGKAGTSSKPDVPTLPPLPKPVRSPIPKAPKLGDCTRFPLAAVAVTDTEEPLLSNPNKCDGGALELADVIDRRGCSVAVDAAEDDDDDDDVDDDGNDRSFPLPALFGGDIFGEKLMGGKCTVLPSIPTDSKLLPPALPLPPCTILGVWL